MNMIKENISIEKLFNDLLEEGHQIQIYKGSYELIENPGIEVLTIGNVYKPVKYVSRHKTNKHLLKISVKFNDIAKYVVTTTDHVCMVYGKDHFFENVDAKKLRINDYVSIYDEENDVEHIGSIIDIEDLGVSCKYVYDLEVEDDSHVFYANDILVHNSFFLNIDCVTKSFKKKYSLGDDIAKWSDDDKLNLWKYMDNFGENVLNPHQQELIKNYCHTEHPEVLRYSMEYIGACGIYEAKKHYGVYKILSEGPEIVNKIKYSGIELKKATSPIKVKEILGDIYSGILTKNWGESEFNEYLTNAYDEFKKLSIDDLAMWKGYNTAREADGFLNMATGATGISSACTYYNQLIDKLGLGKKYEQIMLGQKVRFCYILPDNEYGISYIAYHDGQWPKEFNQIFHVDYDVMFDKLITSALKGFYEATRFSKMDPRKPILFDIFSL